MVEGMMSFRDKFEGYEDCYTIIGGAACDILMSEAELSFRRTKDIDIILILEDKRAEFARIFWEYIKEGDYKCGWKNSPEMHFYRFTEPKAGYPVMIELFSKKPGYQLEITEGIIPVHIEEDISSLSAILLQKDFYDFMLRGKRTVQGVSVLTAEYLIPFKMYAWLDLKQRKAQGEHVNEKDYKKHKNDVFRLLQLVDPDESIQTEGLVKEKIHEFIEEIKYEKVRLEQLGMDITQEEAQGILEAIYV